MRIVFSSQNTHRVKDLRSEIRIGHIEEPTRYEVAQQVLHQLAEYLQVSVTSEADLYPTHLPALTHWSWISIVYLILRPTVSLTLSDQT